MKRFRETRVSGEKVFDGKLLQVYKDTVQLPTGNKTIREYIKHQGAAVVVPLLKDKILFVKQYRYPTQQVMLELPAGKIDPGENVQATVQRELGEETGYTSEKIYPLQPIHPCVGYSDEKIYLFFATDLVKSHLTPDEDETLSVVSMVINEAMEKIFTGEITDSKTIIGLFWAEKLLKDPDFYNRFIVEK